MGVVRSVTNFKLPPDFVFYHRIIKALIFVGIEQVFVGRRLDRAARRDDSAVGQRDAAIARRHAGAVPRAIG